MTKFMHGDVPESLADDLLSSAAEIGAFMGESPRRVYYLYETTDIPLFKLSNSARAELQGRRSGLISWLEKKQCEDAAERAAKREAKRAAKRRKPFY